MPLIYIIAGEASGDVLGAGLMRELRAQQPDTRFAGIGGEAMQHEGLQSLFPYNDLAIMGFLEILPHIPRLLYRLRQTAQDIARQQPDAVITIDSPGFTFRLARKLLNGSRTHNIPRIHYVAPSVWAYKPQRAHTTAQLFNLLLTLLPFESAYFEKEGLTTVCVGHPVLWNVAKGDGSAFRQRHAIDAEVPVLLLLPGSRVREIKRHLPLFLESAKFLPGFRLVVLASPSVKDIITRITGNAARVIDSSEKQDAFAAATLALSKSGTITLELAAANVPAIVAHRVNALSAWLFRRMVKIPYVSLVNIAAQQEILPELLQERCAVAEITCALHNLSAPEVREKQRLQYAKPLAMLKGDNTVHPDIIAAQSVMESLRLVK